MNLAEPFSLAGVIPAKAGIQARAGLGSRRSGADPGVALDPGFRRDDVEGVGDVEGAGEGEGGTAGIRIPASHRSIYPTLRRHPGESRDPGSAGAGEPAGWCEILASHWIPAFAGTTSEGFGDDEGPGGVARAIRCRAVSLARM